MNLIYYIFLLFFVGEYLYGQNSSRFNNQMLSADVNLGYNLSRIKSNYIFAEQMPYSFQINWHKANYHDQKRLNNYSYSDFGISFLYHNFRDDVLGKNFGLYGFMSYYLLKPQQKFQLSFRISQGIAYNTHPYDKQQNSKNQLFGSHWLFPFDIGLYLKSPKIYQNWRLQLGLAIFHYSNGNLQSPNYGANIPSMTIGLLYDRRSDEILPKKQTPEYDKTWQYLGFLRFGINESDYYDSGQFPFFIPGFQVEKHLNFRHKINFGVELFVSYFLKEQIRYEHYAMPEYHLDDIPDFKRIGIYAGHEFYYKKFGIDISAGYYIYYPYNFETRFYNRLATKYYLNKHWRLLYGLKVHGINRAEAMEFGVMYRILTNRKH